MDVRTPYDSVRGEFLSKLLFSLVSPWYPINVRANKNVSE
jgi:hypothetical protein